MDKNCADSLRVGHWSWPCLSIMGVLNGLSEAPQQGLSPLGSVGTDIIVKQQLGQLLQRLPQVQQILSELKGLVRVANLVDLFDQNAESLKSLNLQDAPALLQAN
jgi:hypothetical protein